MAGRDQIIDEMCRLFVQEAADTFPHGIWPDAEGDDGLRSEPGDPPAYIRLLPEGQQEEIRRAMGFAYDVARAALAQGGRGDV